jgi:glycosyltransferase involved in cell wall biosynthesis
MPSLSVVILTKNEEKNIAACLEGVAWADEMLVLDSSSTDRTVTLAREHGARVEQRPFVNYAQQRDAGLDLAMGDWVFIQCSSASGLPITAIEGYHR